MFWHPKIGLLSHELDGMLDPKAKLFLTRHLSSCASCRTRSEALSRVREKLRALPAIEEGFLSREPEPSPAEPSVPSALPWRALFTGGVLGVCLASLFTILQREPALRVIWHSREVVTSGGRLGGEVLPGTALRTLSSGYVDLELPGQLLLRMKPESMVTWQQVNRPWSFGRPNIVVNLMRGEVLARTQPGFWGSHLILQSPMASARIKGTALSMKVDPVEDLTVLKVLTGSVFFSPHLESVGLNVGPGQASRIQGARLPEPPISLTEEERRLLLETYRIGQGPMVDLVISSGPERLDELLRPALLYLSDRTHPSVSPLLRKAVGSINTAILKGDLEAIQQDLQVVELALGTILDEELAVPLRLFIGAVSTRLGDPKRALLNFRWVAEETPDHPLASLALAAMGMTARSQLWNLEMSREAFQQILKRYPRSPEAGIARRFLHSH